MASVTVFPTTMQGWTGLSPSGTANWSNPNNAKADDEAYATVVVAKDSESLGPEQSNYLYFHNFAFGIGAGATINGVEFELQAKSTDATKDIIVTMRLVKTTSTLVGTDQSASNAIPTSDTIFTFGNPTSLWGTTLTQAEVSASGFGVVMAVRTTNTTAGASSTISVDYGKMTVYYTGGSVSVVDYIGAVQNWTSGYPSYLAF